MGLISRNRIDPSPLNPPLEGGGELNFASLINFGTVISKEIRLMHQTSRLVLIFLGMIFFGLGLSSSIAQVKMDDPVKKRAKPAAPAKAKRPPAPAASGAAARKQTCDKTPAGCSTTFTPVAGYVAPAWYASQEKNQNEADNSQQKAIAYLEKYKGHAIKRGWELNDIARSYAFFVALTYNVYSQGKGPDRAQMETLTKRFRRDLAKDSKLQANNDRERQFIYERLILVALDNEAGYVFAKKRNDSVSQQKHRERAKFWLEDVIEKPVEQIPSYWK